MKNTIFEEMVNKKLNFIIIYTEDFENISLKSETKGQSIASFVKEEDSKEKELDQLSPDS